VFESGVMVLQLQSHSEEAITVETEEAVCLQLLLQPLPSRLVVS